MATITNNDRLLIEKHLDDALNDAEKNLFNQRLEDADFKQEVALYAQAVQSVHRLGDDKIKAMLVKEHQKLEKKAVPAVAEPPQYKPLKVVFTRQKMALAASFLLLVSVGLWFLMGQNGPKINGNEQVFDAAFTPHDNLTYGSERSARRGGGDEKIEEKLSNLQKAFACYDGKEYSKAVQFFELPDVVQQFPNDSLNLYKAMCFLKLNKPDQALISLKMVENTPNSALREASQWYLALTYLKINDVAKAKELLIAIQHREENGYAKKAGKLLGELSILK
jgi:tetratricopeptide (TPR) repeat protein